MTTEVVVTYTGQTQVVQVNVPGAQGPQGEAGSGGGGGGTWGSITGTLSAQTDLQSALDAKAPLASPTFTGTVSGVTKAMVGLGNVDNTADASKPVSTAQAAADAAVLSTAQAYTDAATVGLLDDRGNYDASVNTFPASGGSGTAGAVVKGDLWTISVGGTLGGVAVTAGDVVRALVNTPGQTAGNWAVTENNLGYVPENSASKNIAGGYAGLASSFRLQLLNALGTVTSFITTAATAARTWTFPDKDGTVAMLDDITGTNSGTNTGDETGARLATLHHAASAKTVLVDADEVTGGDSAASFGLIRTTWANVWTYINTKAAAVYQAALVSGTNIKTVGGTTLLGSGDVPVVGAPLAVLSANVVEQKNGLNGQTHRIYGAETSGSIYRRFSMSAVGGAYFQLMLEQLGGVHGTWALDIGNGTTQTRYGVNAIANYVSGVLETNLAAGVFASATSVRVPLATTTDYHKIASNGFIGGYGGSDRFRLTLSGGNQTADFVNQASGTAGLRLFGTGAGNARLVGGPPVGSDAGHFTISPTKIDEIGGYSGAGRAMYVTGGAAADPGATARAGGPLYLDGGPQANAGAAGDVYVGNTRGNLRVIQDAYFSKLTFLGQYTNASEPSWINGGCFFNTDLDKMRIGGASAWETVTSV